LKYLAPAGPSLEYLVALVAPWKYLSPSLPPLQKLFEIPAESWEIICHLVAIMETSLTII